MSQPSEYKYIRKLSSSAIKTLEFNPRKFYDETFLWLQGHKQLEERLPSDAQRLGSLVDVLLLSPELYESTFFISPNPPSGQMGDFCTCIYRELRIRTNNFEVEATKELLDELGQLCYIEAGFKRDGYEKVLEKFKVEGKDYVNGMRANRYKVPITQEELSKAQWIVQNLKSHEYIGKILAPEEGKELLSQLIVEGEIDGVEFKGMIDLVVIDHDTKLITFYDLKTTSEWDFSDTFFKWRYDIQQNVYTLLLRQWAQEYYPHYYIFPMEFIVAHTKGGQPSIQSDYNTKYDHALESRKLRSGKIIPGLADLIKQYKWHVLNGKWNFTPTVYGNNGVTIIDI